VDSINYKQYTMNEIFILRTIQLHSTNGVVHIESIGYGKEDGAYIEFDARALLDDIPHLYRMAKQAIAMEDAHTENKYRDMMKQINKDVKRPVGRPPKD